MRKTDRSLTPPWAQDSVSLNFMFLNEYNYMYIYFLRQDLIAQVGLELTILLSFPPESLLSVGYHARQVIIYFLRIVRKSSNRQELPSVP